MLFIHARTDIFQRSSEQTFLPLPHTLFQFGGSFPDRSEMESTASIFRKMIVHEFWTGLKGSKADITTEKDISHVYVNIDNLSHGSSSMLQRMK
ncbi:hypothetical protein [Mailhella massiliensis]|uniref:hypothetical protein n=1 Tax=Mailhella massiliensis TaxID=1903261 RepID=UPI0023F0C91C|nr:hypothetical protein [Mailhella massiliensis]